MCYYLNVHFQGQRVNLHTRKILASLFLNKQLSMQVHVAYIVQTLFNAPHSQSSSLRITKSSHPLRGLPLSLSSFLKVLYLERKPGSSVGIATELWAGRSGERIPVGRDFPPVQTGPEAHPASRTMGTGSFPRVKYGRGVLLTTHPLLVSWSTHPLGHNRACNGNNLHFLLYLERYQVLSLHSFCDKYINMAQ